MAFRPFPQKTSTQDIVGTLSSSTTTTIKTSSEFQATSSKNPPFNHQLDTSEKESIPLSSPFPPDPRPQQLQPKERNKTASQLDRSRYTYSLNSHDDRFIMPNRSEVSQADYGAAICNKREVARRMYDRS